jgi:hypothetical protein
MTQKELNKVNKTLCEHSRMLRVRDGFVIELG